MKGKRHSAKRNCPVLSAIRKIRKDLREKYGEESISDNKEVFLHLSLPVVKRYLKLWGIDLYNSVKYFIQKERVEIMVSHPVKIVMFLALFADVNSGLQVLENLGYIYREPGCLENNPIYILKPEEDIQELLENENVILESSLESEPGGKGISLILS